MRYCDHLKSIANDPLGLSGASVHQLLKPTGSDQVLKYWNKLRNVQQPHMLVRSQLSSQLSVKDWTSASLNAVLGCYRMLCEPTAVAKLAHLLRCCGNTNALPDGRRVHSHILECGYESSTFLGNCLVQMYGNCGSLPEAQAVFDRLPSPNMYSWNILIEAYSQNGRLDEARNVFHRMHFHDVVSWTAMITTLNQNGQCEEALFSLPLMLSQSVMPNNITFICAVDACASLAAFEEGRKIHAAVVDRVNEGNGALGTALVNMYGKCGSLDDASRVFSSITYRDVVSWTAMIAAFAQNNGGRKALDLFLQMESEGVKPNCVTFVSALIACSSVEALAMGQKIHIDIIDSRYDQNVMAGNALINMYGKCKKLDDAKAVFARMVHRDVNSWTVMIAAHSQNGYCKAALDLFGQMQFEGFNPNKVTFVCALDACASLEGFEEGMAIHVALVQSGYERDVIVGTALVNMYSKCRSLDEAREVFNKMSHRNVVSWNTMITALAQNGKGQEAVYLFDQMYSARIKPNSVTFICVLDACADLVALKWGQEIHDSILECRYEEDAAVGTALINMYSKCGSLDSARNVFGKMLDRDAVSWYAMIATCTHHGHGQDALDLFRLMQFEGIKPDGVAFVNALDACTSLGAVEEGKQIHATLVDFGYEQDIVMENALIKMYGKCGALNNARNVFKRMSYRNVISWTAMIAAFAHNGHGKEALASFYHMQLKGFQPNSITFTCILNACSHTGLVDAGKCIFYSMDKDHGITHTIDHYLCIIDLLGRAGHLDEAELIIGELPVDVAVAGWFSLLGACKIHGDVERGLRVANHCFELDWKNPAPYSMLSNIFAAAGTENSILQLGGIERKGLVQHC